MPVRGLLLLAALLAAAALLASAALLAAVALLAAAGGAALNRLADDQRAQRTISLALAVVLAASVAFIWI